MKIIIKREAILRPLQIASGVVERRQTLPILSHVLLNLSDETLSLTATDLEVELVAHTPVDSGDAGEVTLPARKFMDICRALPENVNIELVVEQERAVVRAGKSRFTLATLPASEFPSVEPIQEPLRLRLAQRDLKWLIDRTHFAMAQQDVRYYLNGLLFEVDGAQIRTVATDGHRLAVAEQEADLPAGLEQQVIIPRKAIVELGRLLEDVEESVEVELGNNHVRFQLGDLVFTSKLIDGRFPDYKRVVPTGGDKVLRADREELKQALSRASILSNEKYRGIRLQLTGNLLRIHANNPEQEEAEEELEVAYEGEELEIGFNVNYLLDALTVISTPQVRMTFTDANSSCLIQDDDSDACKYVVMPMRL